MSNLITSETHKLLDYLRTHHVITQIQNAVERVLQFLYNHASQIATLVKGSIKAMKNFPANPDVKNVFDWIQDELIPVLENILTQIGKQFPQDHKYIVVMKDVIQDIGEIMNFLEKFLY